MASNLILFGWNRSIPGREKLSAQHFDEFVKYLSGLQKNGAIQTFEVVFLNTHGGDLNGFFLIEGRLRKAGFADFNDRVDYSYHSRIDASR